MERCKLLLKKGNTQLEQLFCNYLVGQLKNLHKEKNIVIEQKESTAQPNEETTIPPTTEDRPKEVLTLNPTAPSDNIENQKKEVEITQDSADINNNQVAEKSLQIVAGVNTQAKLTSSKTYIISVGCGIGTIIAYLAGATALTPAISAVAVFIAAAVFGALIGYCFGKFCEKVSEERQKDRHMSIGTAITNVLTECLKSQEGTISA